ncbi:MAG: hypothetical protein MSQ83_03655 [Phascolarctobacterium sp.]|nr:hypothetical protein [Phascolarctobacterium sp.]
MKFFAYLKKLNKLGVAMTEYAVLLAFVAAIGASFTSDSGLGNSISGAVNKAVEAIGLVSGDTSSNNKSYKLPGFANEDHAAEYGAYVDQICNLIFNEYSDKQIAGFKYTGNGDLNFLYVYEKDKNGNDIIARYQYPGEYQYGNDKTVHKTNINDLLNNSNFTKYNLASNDSLVMCFDKNGNLTNQMPQDLQGSNKLTTNIRFKEVSTGKQNTLFKINSDGNFAKQ